MEIIEWFFDYFGWKAIGIILLLLCIEWLIGKAIGKRISNSTGLVLGIILLLCGAGAMGIAILVYSTPNKNNNKRTKNSGALHNFSGKNYKDLLIENNLGEYIEIFEKNKLTDISILLKLNEADLEKMGIHILGDRKRILDLFSTNENIQNNHFETESEEYDTVSSSNWYCSNCGSTNNIYEIKCKKCGKIINSGS